MIELGLRDSGQSQTAAMDFGAVAVDFRAAGGVVGWRKPPLGWGSNNSDCCGCILMVAGMVVGSSVALSSFEFIVRDQRILFSLTQADSKYLCSKYNMLSSNRLVRGGFDTAK
ncbi:hypothetical protein V6N11_080673 [Hibiscus sabdariffa]|uniref:Uncharacterized protein n=1 Tax=Hibiscus sabdariffa TaxID=183260 RepID=A0ABR2QHK2_9ROSI